MAPSALVARARVPETSPYEDRADAIEWVSGISSLLSALIGIVTLLTVYVAATEVLNRRRQYQLGTSAKSLGPWKDVVVDSSILRMQTRIKTPKMLSLPDLVEDKWEPELEFPTGFPDVCEHKPSTGSRIKVALGIRKSTHASSQPELGNVNRTLAGTSWVNFLQSVDITPDTETRYELQAESELVNGIVPMRWKGSDLVVISALLGFQAGQKEPSFREPMPLPTQWSGPIGWLQFRASNDGCIVEFRRRRDMPDRFSQKLHHFFNNLVIDPQYTRRCLKARLWQSINGFYLPNGNTLYLGGSDEDQKKRRNVRTMEDICNHVQERGATPAEIKAMIWGGLSKQPTVAQMGRLNQGQGSKFSRADLESLPEFLRDLAADDDDDGKQTVRVLSRAPGLLSRIVEGEWTKSRGLDFDTVEEFRCEYLEIEEVDRLKYPYKLGRLVMDGELLQLLKAGISLVKPDGYYFTPTRCLAQDVGQIYAHVNSHLNNVERIIPDNSVDTWHTDWKPTDDNEVLYHAIDMCNSFQRSRQESRAVYTIRDMKIMNKCSGSLRRTLDSHAGANDLGWAMISNPQFFTDLAKILQVIDLKDLFDIPDKWCFTANGKVDIGRLATIAVERDMRDLDDRGEYEVPFLETEEKREFSAAQLVAAYVDIVLTFFWIEQSWVTDVARYDVTIPQSVSMC